MEAITNSPRPQENEAKDEGSPPSAFDALFAAIAAEEVKPAIPATQSGAPGEAAKDASKPNANGSLSPDDTDEKGEAGDNDPGLVHYGVWAARHGMST